LGRIALAVPATTNALVCGRRDRERRYEADGPESYLGRASTGPPSSPSSSAFRITRDGARGLGDQPCTTGGARPRSASRRSPRARSFRWLRISPGSARGSVIRAWTPASGSHL